MRKCTVCKNSELKDGKSYCHVRGYFVSVQAEWCDDLQLDSRYELWKFFSDNHGLILTEGELTDIVREVEKYQNLKM